LARFDNYYEGFIEVLERWKTFQQNTITAIFKRITSKERKVALQHEVKLFNVNAHVPNKATLKQVEKCVVGRL